MVQKQQSRRQHRDARRARRTRRLRKQRGGGDTEPVKDLREWLNRVQQVEEAKQKVAGAKPKGEPTLDLQFDTFEDASLQLPPLKKETGHAGTAPETEPQFQLNKRGTAERLFEDSDLRQIGNALRLIPRASMIKVGHSVLEFQSSSQIDTDDDSDKILQEIEEAMRYVVAPAADEKPISISDAKNYPLYLFYLLMNLPPDMNTDNAIPLVIRSKAPTPEPAAPAE